MYVDSDQVSETFGVGTLKVNKVDQSNTKLHVERKLKLKIQQYRKVIVAIMLYVYKRSLVNNSMRITNKVTFRCLHSDRFVL